MIVVTTAKVISTGSKVQQSEVFNIKRVIQKAKSKTGKGQNPGRQITKTRNRQGRTRQDKAGQNSGNRRGVTLNIDSQRTQDKQGLYT